MRPPTRFAPAPQAKHGAQPATPALPISARLNDTLRLPDPFRAVPGAGFKPAIAPPPPGAPRTKFVTQSPDLLHELGLTCAAMGAPWIAIDALREATRINPAMPQAWQKLSDMLHQAGELQAARAAAEKAAEHATMPTTPRPAKPLSAGKLAAAEARITAMLRQNQGAPAIQMLREHLLDSPTDAAALRVLANHRLQERSLDIGQSLLERALQLVPHYTAARQDLINLLLQRNRWASALVHVERALAQNPGDKDNILLQAQLLKFVGDTDGALAIYEGILRRESPKEASFWLCYGGVLKDAGRRAESERAYRTAILLSPSTGVAYWGISDLKSNALGDADIEAMRAWLASDHISGTSRFHFYYAMGHAMETRGDFAASFANYAAGARLRHTQVQGTPGAYSADLLTLHVNELIQAYTPPLFAAHTGGCPDPAPIFVVGMPRSGSTLIEQILASHSQIEGTQELPEMGAIVRDLDESRRLVTASAYPSRLHEIPAAELTELGHRYMQRCQKYRRTNRPYFIDKMPGNWSCTGLIHLVLPHAKIIDARRHPMAACFGTFKQLIIGGAGYSYNLTDIARRYRDYARLMAHFDSLLPGRVLRVHYEDVVENTEAEIRRMLAYCGVDFESQCLRFWENERAVRTPSAEQVRRPIFRGALDQWRNFEPYLGTLKQSLGPIATTYPELPPELT